jgi:two-component system response regulator YesN
MFRKEIRENTTLIEGVSKMWKAIIVDDEYKIIQIMRNIPIWNELEIEVIAFAIDGQEGLDLIITHKPDIVITDIYMPVMNGLEMIEQLRSHNFSGKIIVLSGYSDFDYARQALRLQVDDYICKPISLETMKEVLVKSIHELEKLRIEQFKQDQLMEMLTVYEPYVQKKWMNYVVTGRHDADFPEVQEINNKFKHWNFKSHIVLVIEMMKTERIAGLSFVDQRLFYFGLNNIIQEIARNYWPDFHFVELYSHHCALLLHSQNQDDNAAALKQIIEMVENIVESVFTYLQIDINVGIGSFKNQWSDIARSTDEGFFALFYKNKRVGRSGSLYTLPEEFSKKDIHKYNEIKHEILPIKMYQDLSEAISHARMDQAITVIQQFIIQLDGIHKLPMTYLRNFGYELWTIMINSFSKAGIQIENKYPRKQIQDELDTIASPQEMEKCFIEKIKELGKEFQSDVNLKHRHAVEFIMQYVHDNYHQELVLNEIADQICISRSYLSYIFKKATGDTFNNYVTRVRIEKAKAMILEGKYLIYEVSELVGYKNVPYFSTLFKKVTGMNPTQLYERFRTELSSNSELN